MTDKLSVGSTLSGERAVSIEVTQADREAALTLMSEIGRARADLNGDAIRAGAWDATTEVQAFALHAAPLREALAAMLERYTSLVNCGDCGNWNPEEESEVIAARSALSPSYPMENYNGE